MAVMDAQVRYAGFWTRFTAYALDTLILGIPFVLIIMPIIGAIAFDAEELRKQMKTEDLHGYYALYKSMIEAGLLCMFAWAAIMALITISKWQATPGKRIMDIYVIDDKGGKAKFVQCFLRYMALPLLLMTVQTPERYYIYENLEKLSVNATPTQADLEQSFMTPISELVSLASLVIICLWYGLIAMRPQKTAGHDILFNTRVIYGRP